MNKPISKKIWLLAIFILQNGFLIGQSIDEDRITKLADSIVLANTNLEFFQQLTQKSKPNIFKYYLPNDSIDFNKIESDEKYLESIMVTEYSLSYYIHPNKHHYYRISDHRGASAIAGLILSFDSNYHAYDLPNFEKYMYSLNCINQENIISEEEAESISMEYFNKVKNRKINSSLIYNEKDSTVFWEITSRNALKSLIITETVIIDAVTKWHVETKTSEYHRNFRQRISDWFRGFP